MKREAAAKQKSKGAFVPPDDPFLEGLGGLAAAVADLFWDDGTPRDPWSLSLNWGTGLVTASLNDKEESRSLNSSGRTVREALDALQVALDMPQRPWRYWGKRKR